MESIFWKSILKSDAHVTKSPYPTCSCGQANFGNAKIKKVKADREDISVVGGKSGLPHIRSEKSDI